VGVGGVFGSSSLQPAATRVSDAKRNIEIRKTKAFFIQ